VRAGCVAALLILGGATTALGQTAQGTATLRYEVDLNDRADDLFHVRMHVSGLGPDNAILQFASTAPGTYQVMDIGRYVNALHAFTSSETEIGVERLSTNQWRLSDPAAVAEIRYSIAETWDTPVDEHPVYPMAGTSIEDDHVLINAHAVFPFPTGLQDVPIELRLEYPDEWTIGTPLDADANGTLHADDYDHFVDSPILLGRLSYASTTVTGVPVEIYTYSRTDKIQSAQLLEAMDLVLQAAGEFLGELPVDRYTFQIQWTRPYAMALSLLSMPFCKILPRERVLEQGRGFFQKPTGTGPYMFEEWVRDNRLDIVGVRMARNPRYFRGTPQLEYVELCPHYLLEDFFRGNVHAIPVVEERLLQGEYQIFRDGSIFPFFLGMSCHLPPLNDPQVRRAVALGIDKPEIVRITHEARYHRQLLHSFIPSKLPGFYLTDELNTFSLPQARALLEESGLSPENLPEITLLMEQPRSEFKHRFYIELRRQLGELGIQLREEYFRSVENVRNFRRPYLILSGKRLDFPGPEEIIRPLFASDSPVNLCRYSNAELDDLLLKAEREKSWQARNKIFEQIQKILNREMPAVPLFTQQNQVAVQPFVKGIKNPPLGFYYLKMENIWVER